MVSLLQTVASVDNFVYDPSYYSLVSHDGQATLGYIDPATAQHLIRRGFLVEGNQLQIDPSLDTFAKRNEFFASLGESLRQEADFHEELALGWRNELYVVYCPDTVPYFLVERAFSVLLGVVTYGAHITGYVAASNTSDGQLKMWVPRRSPTKPTYPNMLDNTVAGGLGYPHGVWETVVKESAEEAGLSEEFVKKNARSVGVVQYMHQTPKGRVQPEVEYIYDIEFPNEVDVIPTPVDGESQDFRLIGVSEVLERLQEFKPNCRLVVVDFLIRHGVVTPEDGDYGELVLRCHRRFPFPRR